MFFFLHYFAMMAHYYIIDVNSEIDGQGVDFLNIREDFWSVTDIDDDADKNVEGRKYHLDGFLSEEQRKELIDIFKELKHLIWLI